MKNECYICRKEATDDCLTCEEPVCDNCTVAYSQHNQIDYTLCKTCYTNDQEEKAEYYKEANQ